MHAKKFDRLMNRILLETPSFCATSWHHGIMGTAFDLFDVPKRPLTWEQGVEKFAEIMRIPVDVARAIEIPDVPNEVAKHIPASMAVMQLSFAKAGASADDIQTGWKQICGVA